jgi:hypothetical protein
MKNKNVIRAAVIAGILAWPAIETCRLLEAQRTAAASQQLERTITAQVKVVKGESVAAVSAPLPN